MFKIVVVLAMIAIAGFLRSLLDVPLTNHSAVLQMSDSNIDYMANKALLSGWIWNSIRFLIAIITLVIFRTEIKDIIKKLKSE